RHRDGSAPRSRAPSLEAAAAVAGPLRRDGVRLGLQLVLEGIEARGFGRASSVCERLGEEPVSEPRVARQERAVEVRAEDAPGSAALAPALAVVPEARDDAAERGRVRVEAGPAGVVLEARERPLVARLELALEEDVA